MIRGRSPFRPGVLLFLVIPALALAQAPRRAPAVQGQAAVLRALIEGRYEDVDKLADALDPRDPGAVALKARAAIERGRYAEADAMLARVVDTAPTSDAALELGLLRKTLGGADAEKLLERVALLAGRSRVATEVARGARALRALGQTQDANAAYRAATSAAPTDPAINTGWGELFLETYNKSEALKSFQAALMADPRWTPALLGAARTLADDNPPQAVAMAERALVVNPSSAEVQVFLAEQAADASHHDVAREHVRKALVVNPSSLDAHALLAALAYVEDKPTEFEAEVARVLAIAPNDAEVFRAAGELTAHNYRFDEAVALTRRGLALDPKNPRVLADLGTHLLRTGDELAARTALESSFKIDPYNVATFNLLSMLDTLDTFETIQDGDIVMRLQKDEAPVLKEYALALAHEALAALSARYQFTPKGPFLIEVFPKHDDFAVRTVGLPGMIGALGACFCRVVTMDSPKARPGTFQWEATLWHELAHVITIQMSNQRVPRWLTEGISVFEEKRARPEWGRQQEVEFAGLLERNEAMKLPELNAAFTDPRKISIAYFEASLLVEHIIATYGEPGLHTLLRAYGRGLDTDAALKSALDTSLDGMQEGFDRAMDRQFGAMRKALAVPDEVDLDKTDLAALRLLAAGHTGSFPVQMALGRALEKADQPDEAMKAYERAAGLMALPAGPDSPHMLMARLAIRRKDTPRAIAELEALMAVDFDNVEAPRRLATLFKESGVTDPTKARPVYERIVALDPYDADAHTALGRLALQRNDPAVASREFRVVVALGPVDRAGALTDLGESYFKAGKTIDAKKQTLAALEIAPTYERAQDLLLKIVGPGR